MSVKRLFARFRKDNLQQEGLLYAKFAALASLGFALVAVFEFAKDLDVCLLYAIPAGVSGYLACVYYALSRKVGGEYRQTGR